MTSRRFIWSLWESGPQVVQFALAVNSLGLALILLNPSPTFPSSHSYDWMAAHGTEAQWAAWFIVAGMIGLCGVISKSLHIRVGAALLTSIQTGVMAWTYYISAPVATGWWTYGVMTLLSYWLLWQRVYRSV